MKDKKEIRNALVRLEEREKEERKYRYVTTWKFPHSFKYFSGIEYDYESFRNCREEGCDDEGICRCSRIENAHVTSVNLDSLVREMLGSGERKRVLKESEVKETDLSFFGYGLYRLAVIHSLYDVDSWRVLTCGGYYGEEIDGVELDNGEFKLDCEKLYTLSPDQRIRFVLEKEYGYLLESLLDKTFEEVEVSTKDLIVGNDSYRKKIKPGTYTENYEYPIGIYISDGGKYRLVDGYHRYVDLTKNKETVKIIAAY